jgi:hypothetical protein
VCARVHVVAHPSPIDSYIIIFLTFFFGHVDHGQSNQRFIIFKPISGIPFTVTLGRDTRFNLLAKRDSENIVDFRKRVFMRFLNRFLLLVMNSLLLTANLDSCLSHDTYDYCSDMYNDRLHTTSSLPTPSPLPSLPPLI